MIVRTLLAAGLICTSIVAEAATGCVLDIDGNGQIDALADGLLIVGAVRGHLENRC